MANELVQIQKMIYEIRGQKVMLDRDLAVLYEVEVKRLNEAVKRNIKRFPTDFMFQLTQDEFAEVVANCDHLENLKFRSTMHALCVYRTRCSNVSGSVKQPKSN